MPGNSPPGGTVGFRRHTYNHARPIVLKALQGKKVGAGIGRVEIRKPYPKRYPFNDDSIGIENVSMAKDGVFEVLTAVQQASLKWLLDEFVHTLRLSTIDIFRHSEVSWKLESEGASAKW